MALLVNINNYVVTNLAAAVIVRPWPDAIPIPDATIRFFTPAAWPYNFGNLQPLKQCWSYSSRTTWWRSSTLVTVVSVSQANNPGHRKKAVPWPCRAVQSVHSSSVHRACTERAWPKRARAPCMRAEVRAAMSLVLPVAYHSKLDEMSEWMDGLCLVARFVRS